MKKASAFSVFHGKKKSQLKDDKTANLPPLGIDGSVPLRRAQSSQSVLHGSKKQPGSGSGSKAKGLLNALKRGNLRESIRRSNKKQKSSSLTSINNDSPFVGFDQISLVGPKSTDKKEKPKAKKKLLESHSAGSVSTPLSSQSPRDKKQRPASESLNVSMTTKLSKLNLKQKSPSIKSMDLSSVKTTPSRTNGDVYISPVSMGSGIKRKGKNQTDEKGSRKKRKKANGLSNAQEAISSGSSDWPYMYDSCEEGNKLFECIIHPVKPERFFTELWERKPLLVKRHTPDYNKGWFSTEEFDKILRQENIKWGVNLDATTFVKDKRSTHNQVGRAYAPVVWDMYQAGCSMRLLNPQTYSRNVWKVLSVLQECFGCFVGANIYLTPPGTQGFAPHYDDIEAFVIQLEGKKHWRLYSPRNEDEILPRFSSGNFSQSDMGEPILDTVLEAGDLLYFPRGTIHQGNATDEHSLHITVSCYQLNTYGDLLLKLLPTAIEKAIEENQAFRQGLPRNYLNFMGIVHSERDIPERRNFSEKVVSLINTLTDSLPIDSSCDQLGKQLMHDSLPPVLSESEKLCSIHGAGERWDEEHKCVLGVSEIQPDTEIKLIRKGCIRLLTEDDQVRVYYNTENSRIYRGHDPCYFEITAEMAPAVECLIHTYPEYISVESLPLDALSNQITITSILYERGLLVTSMPLKTTYDEPGDVSDDESEDDL